MKRPLVATLIFVSPIVLLLLATLLAIFREFLRGRSMVIVNFHFGSPPKILAGIGFLVVLGFVAYWLSGKLVKERMSRS